MNIARILATATFCAAAAQKVAVARMLAMFMALVSVG